MVLVVFGIIAVHQFGGKGYSCNDGSIPNRAYCVGWWVSSDDGLLRQRVWSQPFSNFDNLGSVSSPLDHRARCYSSVVKRKLQLFCLENGCNGSFISIAGGLDLTWGDNP